jgi:hypothetical protein
MLKVEATPKSPKHPTLPRACTGERFNKATLAGSNERRKVDVPLFGVDSMLNVEARSQKLIE